MAPVLVTLFLVLYTTDYSAAAVRPGYNGQTGARELTESTERVLLQLMAKVDRQEAMIQQLNSRLAGDDDARKQCDQRIVQLEMNVARHEGALEQCDQRIVQLERNLVRHECALEQRDQRFGQQGTNVARHEDALEQHDQRIVQLETNVTRHEDALKQRDQLFGQLETQAAGHEDVMKQRDQRIVQLETNLARHDAALKQRDQRIVQLETQVAGYEDAQKQHVHKTPELSAVNLEIEGTGSTADRADVVSIKYRDFHMYNGTMHISRPKDRAVAGGSVTGRRRENKTWRPTLSNKGIHGVVLSPFTVRVGPVTTTGVAFSASMSNRKTVHINEVLVYDGVILDIGSGYSSTEGIYTVPATGVYVFTWTTIAEVHTNVLTHLQINGVTYGSACAYAGTIGDYQSATGVIVRQVNVGDHVYIRIRLYDGTIISGLTSNKGQTTFSGWRLF